MFNLTQAENLLENFKRINSALPVKDEETTDDSQESLEEIILDLEKAQQLIRDFEKLDKPLARKKTFLEIIGVNHLEAVSSKALAFFFDTEEAHGLKDMCIQALVELINQQKFFINSDLPIKTKYINREVSTVDKKRIDLVIDCHDSLIIIENKISHNPDNPFKSYIEYGDEKAQEMPVHYVLLGIQEPVERIEPFIFISHFKLVKAILSKLNEYIFNADQYYLTLLLDYLNSIELLNTESEIGKMEKAIANFFANNLEKIQEIYEAREHFIAFIEQKLLSTKEILSARNSNLLQNVETVDNYPYILGGYISSNNYKVKNHPINFDVNIVNYADGCWLTMDFFKCDIYRKSPSNCLDILKQIAIDIGLDYESDELNHKDCLTIKAMDWNETPEEIANQILPILQKIELYIIKEKQNI